MTIKQFWINLIRDIKENFFSILLSTIGILIFSYASSILYKYYTSVDCILDYKNYNISNTKLLEPNEYGDYFGGVMNPLIGITAAFITFLAFYIQFVANRKITGQFKIQQFESHFYEMLRLHKENVDELEVEIISLTSIKSTSGHHVRWEQQFKTVKGRNVFIPLSNEIEIAFNSLKTTGESDLMKVFKESYKVFFNGLNKDSLFYTTLESVKVNHEEEYWNRKKHGLPNEFFYGAKMKAFYEIFLGHENMLGHYYRHLYHMVKFVVIENDTILNYKDKRKYLKLLRAQLSNYEQAMLFYNWLAGNGENWEKNKFFTDYRMIHNLHDNILIDQGYFVKIKKSLRESNPNYKMLDDDDFLFESDTEK